MRRAVPVGRRGSFVMRRILSAFAVLVALSSSASAGPAEPNPAALVSKLRAAYGLGPVRIDPALTRAAERQAQAMASSGVLSHEIGGSFRTRMNSAGLGNVVTAENVGVGHRSAQGAIASWERSPDHQSNMLMREVTRIGLARSGPYWAMVMASDDSPGVYASSGFTPVLLPFGVGFMIGR